jgi:hypothetical protein
MSLKCAVDLGIPEAIHRRGGTATLADIATDTKVHPAKLADLQRVMELLSVSGIFSTTASEDGGAVLYGLTTTCRFLVGWRNLSPMVPFLANPLVVSSFFSMPDWLRSEPAPAGAGSLFELAHGCSQWEMGSKDAEFSSALNNSRAADNQLFLEVIIFDKGRIFRGMNSLVDVGAGKGEGTKIIAGAFPRIKCTVMDLPHIVGQDADGTGHDNLQFIAGDMFQSIPSADAVVLKVFIIVHNTSYMIFVNTSDGILSPSKHNIGHHIDPETKMQFYMIFVNTSILRTYVQCSLSSI